MLDAIRKIRDYVASMHFETFQQDTRTIDAVIRNLIVIGETARHVPPNIVRQYPAIPWRLMGDLRNFAVHEYWNVELRTIWQTVQDDLPPLIPLLTRLIDE